MTTSTGTSSLNSTSSVDGIELPGRAWGIDPPEGWLVIPSTVTEAPELVAEWESGAVTVIRESLATQPDGSVEVAELIDTERAELDLLAADSVTNLRAFADGMAPDGHRVVAALGVLGNGPVPVLVAVGVSDPSAPDDGLLATLGATGGDPAMAPDVEHLDLPDGDGVRVTRLDIDEHTGGAWISISVGRRIEHRDAVVDTVLVWRSMDLFLAAVMVELLDELLPTVQVTRSGT